MSRRIFVSARGEPLLKMTELMYEEWLVEFEPTAGTGRVVTRDDLLVLLKELDSIYVGIQLERTH